MKKTRLFFSVITFLCILSSMVLANGLNLNSLGTRALTMGGAFVGLADDFSAIYWNPAGIAQFKTKYFGFYGTDVIPSNKYKMDIIDPVWGPVTVVNAKTESKHYLSGLAAYYYPVSESVVAGIGVYVPSGLGAHWDGADFELIANDNPNLEWRSKIGLVTIAPALAFKVNEQFYIGAALNINYGMFDIAMHAGAAPNPVPPPDEVDLGQYEESMKGWGYGAVLGVLFKPNDVISLGATLRTASTVRFKGDASISNLIYLGMSPTSDLEREVTWPMWLAGGVAFRPMESLILTGDVQWTQWSKLDVIRTDYTDTAWQLLMAAGGDDEMPLHWNNAIQVRFGAEYRMNNIAIRGGYYNDPSPAPDRTMNVLLPNFDFSVITAGFGYMLNGLQLDFGIEYLIGKERDVPLSRVAADPDWETAMPGTYNMNIIVPTISISYRF